VVYTLESCEGVELLDRLRPTFLEVRGRKRAVMRVCVCVGGGGGIGG
jgi:hypothetical protein